MSILRYIKAGLMILLVGSAIVFSSAMVQQASHEAQKSLTTADTASLQSQFKEVEMLVFILAALGVAIYVLVMTFSIISDLKMKDFLDRVLSKSNQFHLA